MPEPSLPTDPAIDPSIDATAGRATDARLDAAIARYPLAPLPPGFIEGTMLRIAAEAAPGMGEPSAASIAGTRGRPGTDPRAASPSGARPPGRPVPRFRLGFLDLVLPAFFAGLLCLVGATMLWGLGRVNPLWAEYAKLDARLAWQSAQLMLPPAVLVGLLFVVGLGLAFAIGGLLMLGVPAGPVRRPALRRA